MEKGLSQGWMDTGRQQAPGKVVEMSCEAGHLAKGKVVAEILPMPR